MRMKQHKHKMHATGQTVVANRLRRGYVQCVFPASVLVIELCDARNDGDQYVCCSD